MAQAEGGAGAAGRLGSRFLVCKKRTIATNSNGTQNRENRSGSLWTSLHGGGLKGRSCIGDASPRPGDKFRGHVSLMVNGSGAEGKDWEANGARGELKGVRDGVNWLGGPFWDAKVPVLRDSCIGIGRGRGEGYWNQAAMWATTECARAVKA